MKYICTRCGRIMPFEDPVLVIDPDGDARCMDCYQKDRTDWFDDEPEEPEKPEEPEVLPQLDYNGRPIKEKSSLLVKIAVIIFWISCVIVAFCLMFPSAVSSVIDWLACTRL